MSRRVLSLLMLAAVVAAGCSNEAGDDDLARGAVDGFLGACVRDEPRLASELAVPAARDLFVGRGGDAACAQVLGASSLRELGEARIEAVDAEDGAATAVLSLPSGETTVALSHGRDGWRLEGPHPEE